MDCRQFYRFEFKMYTVYTCVLVQDEVATCARWINKFSPSQNAFCSAQASMWRNQGYLNARNYFVGPITFVFLSGHTYLARPTADSRRRRGLGRERPSHASTACQFVLAGLLDTHKVPILGALGA